MLDAVRRRGGLLLRILFSALLLGVVLVYADVSEVLRAVRDGDWGWFAVGTALMAAAVAIGGIRWRVLLEGAGIGVARSRAIRVFAGAMILNNVLPTSVGGDALRTWLVGKESGRLLGAAAATIVDRVTGVVFLFVLGWAALAVDAESVPSSVVGVFAGVTLGLVAALAVAALAAAGVRPVLHRLPERVARLIREGWTTLRTWASSARLVASLVTLGFAYQVLAVLALVAVGKTVGLELSFALAAVSVSIVLVAMLIPVSIGGLGVREGGFVLILAQSDIDAARATLLSLLGALAIVLASGVVIAAAAGSEVLRARVDRARSPASERAAPGA